jgi:NADH-quinone oxidoreductase subunit F
MQVKETSTRIASRQELEDFRRLIVARRDPGRTCIAICTGTGCHAYDCLGLVAAFREEIQRRQLQDRVDITATGCRGFCERGALLTIYPQGIFYQQVKPEDVSEIISQTIIGGNVIDRLLYSDPNTKELFVHQEDVPFYRKQQRLLLGNNNRIDPTSIEDYLAVGGYTALSKSLFELSPKQIMDEVKRSGLRGRGGGGFPTAIKWESARRAEGSPKYIIGNCDEGDPGAYMDRSLMEGNPHSVLEGMIIGAYAIGAGIGYVYVRHEYPLAVANVTIAIKQAEEYGLLGENILGSGFDFKVKVSRGGGAFVCGESTALMASLEGKVGEPRAKYVHTAEKGLYGKPSNLNNVETWANVPLIVLNGADWYNKIGTKGSKGTKIFSLVGKVNNTGLVEVPMGTTLREIIHDIGGGIREGKKFKSVQTGGPSGGFIPESLLDMPVDFDELTKVGSMMGSGGMIVMDEDNCMVDMAKYFLKFLEEESCGKCLPCREGIKRMLQILTDIAKGRGREEDIAILERLSDNLIDSSLCALGGTAPNPILTTIRYFRDEYVAHIKDRRCPAGVCKDLITYFIVDDKCPGCGLCIKSCPKEAITFVAKKKPVILDQSLCIKCGACRDICKLGAIGVK